MAGAGRRKGSGKHRRSVARSRERPWAVLQCRGPSHARHQPEWNSGGNCRKTWFSVRRGRQQSAACGRRQQAVRGSVRVGKMDWRRARFDHRSSLGCNFPHCGVERQDSAECHGRSGHDAQDPLLQERRHEQPEGLHLGKSAGRRLGWQLQQRLQQVPGVVAVLVNGRSRCDHGEFGFQPGDLAAWWLQRCVPTTREPPGRHHWRRSGLRLQAAVQVHRTQLRELCEHELGKNGCGLRRGQ